MTDPLVDERIEAEEEEEDFANLLDSYESASNDDIRVGDKITAEILSIGMDTIFVTTGTKIDGAVEKHEMLDENQELPYKVGDTIELYIVSLSENEIRLSKALSGMGGFNQLRDAYEMSMPIEGKVREECKGGFHVEIMQQRAFCPISQMDITFIQNPGEYVGNTHRFLIIKFEEKGKNIVVSRRKLLSMEQEAAQKEFFKDNTIDSIIDGKITRLMPYGAFVEIFPGVEGMVHISEISWSRVEKIDEVLNEGDKVKVKILSINDGKKPGQLKISLSIKQVDGDPWTDEKLTINVGDRFKGKVKKCLDFGAFVEIAPGIEGLVHISEMSYVKRILKPEDVVTVGDEVDVVVKNIEKDNKKISLSMRDAEGDPWIGIKDKFSIGQAVEGTIERKERFGYFISLIPGVTGLLPISVIKKFHKPSRIEKLNIGDKISIHINEINTEERRISLGTADSNDEGDWKQFSSDSKSTKGVSDLGEQIKKLNLKFQ
ncbi:30S ribosomal protein S1 [Candidatus Magnetomorum sp. HK-1]|nr:30S ribosomal protein S1 [Candidatus Magnetomorum sp. HK-1]